MTRKMFCDKFCVIISIFIGIVKDIALIVLLSCMYIELCNVPMCCCVVIDVGVGVFESEYGLLWFCFRVGVILPIVELYIFYYIYVIFSFIDYMFQWYMQFRHLYNRIYLYYITTTTSKYICFGMLGSSLCI